MSEGLAKCYRAAGSEFLALRLLKVFKKIETPEDIALHNDVVADIAKIVHSNEIDMVRSLARYINEPKTTVKCQLCGQKITKRTHSLLFLVRIANIIINKISGGHNGKKEETKTRKS